MSKQKPIQFTMTVSPDMNRRLQAMAAIHGVKRAAIAKTAMYNGLESFEKSFKAATGSYVDEYIEEKGLIIGDES